ncbi:MAG: hypothetical protein IPM92_05055 [Saprospiraceae bacterium]|nr:hypothetical protein [Saprospiraceae bacterium]
MYRIQIIFPFPPIKWQAYAFVAIITFAAYYYQKVFCFIRHYPKIDKPSHIHILVLIIPILCALYFFIFFEKPSQVIICIIGSIGLLYHNHTATYLFRNILLLKNISICLCWVLLLFFCFQEHDFTNTKRFFYALDFFIILLAQSLLFDFQDSKEDHAFSHKTLSNILPPHILKVGIAFLFLVSFLLLFNFYTRQWIKLSTWMIAGISYGVYFHFIVKIAFTSKLKSMILTDIIMLFK